MKNKQGNIAIITIIIVIVAITAGVVGWLFAKKSQAPVLQVAVIQPIAPAAQNQSVAQPVAQSSNEAITIPADWKTYSDKNYGFELEYPSTLVSSIVDYTGFHSVQFAENSKNGAMIININVQDNANKTLGMLEKDAKDNAGDTVITENINLSNLNGIPAFKAKHKNITRPLQSPDVDDVIFIKDNKTYYISFTVSGTPNINIADDENEILSTFKFTNTTDETANWQMYTSKRYGYEIKYPKEWIISNTENEDGELSVYNKDYKNAKGDNFFTIDVVSKQFIGKKSLEEWLSDKMRNDKSSETLVLGYRALKFNAPPSTQAPGNIEYDFIKDGMGFILGTIYYDKSDGFGDKILSTFKFTE